jgi:hypothetical protein
MTKLLTIYFSAVLIVSCTGTGTAQDRAQAAQIAVSKMAQETVDCAAYFEIVSLALLHSNEGDTSQEYLAARGKALDRAESLSQGIVNDRYRDTMRDMTNRIVLANMTKQIDQNLSNLSITDISVLGEQYGKLCKEVLSDPGARAKYWMEHVGPAP